MFKSYITSHSFSVPNISQNGIDGTERNASDFFCLQHHSCFSARLLTCSCYKHLASIPPSELQNNPAIIRLWKLQSILQEVSDTLNIPALQLYRTIREEKEENPPHLLLECSLQDNAQPINPI